MGKRVYAFIDGFNLYCGVVKHKPQYKWLDLYTFCKTLMAGDNLIKVKYFTALVKEHGDPRRPLRQQTYWRALKAFNKDKIDIIKGKFRTDPKFYRIAKYQFTVNSVNEKRLVNSATENSICIMKPEEKGSDVNLAVHLVNDAWQNLYDIALVISNDSDLAESLNIAKNCCGKEIALANPFDWKRSGVAKELRDLDLLSRKIRAKQLGLSQLPDNIPGTNIHKPFEWSCE